MIESKLKKLYRAMVILSIIVALLEINVIQLKSQLKTVIEIQDKHLKITNEVLDMQSELLNGAQDCLDTLQDTVLTEFDQKEIGDEI